MFCSTLFLLLILSFLLLPNDDINILMILKHVMSNFVTFNQFVIATVAVTKKNSTNWALSTYSCLFNCNLKTTIFLIVKISNWIDIDILSKQILIFLAHFIPNLSLPKRSSRTPRVMISVANLRCGGHRRLVRRDAVPHTRCTRRKWSVIVWQCRSDRHRFPTLGHSRHLVNITVACSLAHMLHRRLRNGRTFEENFCRTCFEFVGVWSGGIL